MDRKFESTDLTNLVLTALNLVGDIPSCSLGAPTSEEWLKIDELIKRIRNEKLDVRLVSRED